MHRLITYVNSVFLGVILGMIFVATSMQLQPADGKRSAPEDLRCEALSPIIARSISFVRPARYQLHSSLRKLEARLPFFQSPRPPCSCPQRSSSFCPCP